MFEAGTVALPGGSGGGAGAVVANAGGVGVTAPVGGSIVQTGAAVRRAQVVDRDPGT